MTDITGDTDYVEGDPSDTDIDQLTAPLDPDDDVTNLLDDTDTDAPTGQ